MKITLARIIFNPSYKVTPVKQPRFPATSLALLFLSSKLLYHNSGKFLREQHHVQEPHSYSKPEEQPTTHSHLLSQKWYTGEFYNLPTLILIKIKTLCGFRRFILISAFIRRCMI